MESAGKRGSIATFVDRKTKLLPGKIMPDKTAAALNKTAIRVFKVIPAPMRKTLKKRN
jgi:IS30 family transposase